MIRRILFVCTGNICRSPLAEGLMRSMLEGAGLDGDIELDSAGILAREGDPPDETAIAIAAERGFDIRSLRSRPFQMQDFDRFDLILAMDLEQMSHLRFTCPPGQESKLRMFMSYAADGFNRDIVDPYRRRRRVFEQALRDIETACTGLLSDLRRLRSQ